MPKNVSSMVATLNPIGRVTQRVIFSSTILFLALPLTAQFGPPRVISQSPWWGFNYVHELADFDGDGDLDLLTGAQPITIFENTDNAGTFATATVIECWMPLLASELFVLDVNNDGLPDLIRRNPDGGPPIWERNMGGFQFAAGVDIPSLILFDVNGDGDQDAVSKSGSQLFISENDGAGNYSDPTAIAQLIGGNSDLYHLDVDGDGLDDLVFQPPGQSQHGVFRNLGNGTFAQTQTNAISQGSDFHVADVNSDGRMDLVHSTTGVSPYQWGYRPGQPDCTIGASQSLLLSTGTEAFLSSITMADVDGDGQKDLLTSLPNNLLVVRMQGNSAIAPSTSALPNQLGIISGQMSAGDIDGDGLDELVLVNEVFDIPGDGTLLHMPPVHAGVNTVPYFLSISDFDLDGRDDIMTGPFNFYQVGVYKNLGPGEFAPVKFSARLGNDWACDYIDMDDDGDLDVVSIRNDSVFLNTNSGSLNFQEQFLVSGSGLRSVRCADVDADGDVDMIVTGDTHHMRFRNIGGNEFQFMSNISALNYSFGEWHCLGFADIDHDGNPDLLVHQSDIVKWVKNNGAMSFGPKANLPNNFNADWIELRDINGDGSQDLLGGSGGSDGTTQWMPHISGSSYGASSSIVPSGICSQCWSLPLDYDRDGDVDVAVLRSGNNTGYLWLNDGLGAFTPGPSIIQAGWDIEGSAIFGYQRKFRAFDFDDDGDEDILLFSDAIQGRGARMAWVENYGADPFTLSGTVFGDMNANGEFDSGDFALPGSNITASPNGYVALGSSAGTYTLHSNNVDQTVSATLNLPFWSTLPVPPSYTVQPSPSAPDWTGLDFGFVPLVDTSLIHVDITIASAPCSAQNSLWVTLHNQGTRIESGTVTVALNNLFTYVSSAPAASTVNGATFTWSFNDLLPLSVLPIQIVITMPPAQSIGTVWTQTATVLTNGAGGGSPNSFIGSLDGTVACSYDPNDKLVEPAGYGVFGAIPLSTEELTYTIRFQNTGNAPAQDVMLRDQLHPHLDLTSLQVLAYSHLPTEIHVESAGELVVRFDGIQLPDTSADFTGSQGFIKMRFRLMPGLPHLTQVLNTAEIYFDLNEEVVTNTTTSTLVDCSLWEPAVNQLSNGQLTATEGDAYQWYLNNEPLFGETSQTIQPFGPGAYAVEVTSIFGCLAITAPIAITSVGSAFMPAGGLKLFPNPASTTATAILEAPPEPGASLALMDIRGRALITVPMRSRMVSIPCEQLAPGLYVVRVSGPRSTSITGCLMIQDR
jgi:uncharacterized repeat protein (TIGR01451 family)